MFGYVRINQQELKVKDFEAYRGYYCGLCHSLCRRYGRIGQLLLNYDMTFLILLLDGLYEPEEEEKHCVCLPHPLKRHREIHSAASDYAADMTVLLAYQKALDDWRDEHSHAKRVLAMGLYRDYKKLRGVYRRQALTLEDSIRKLSEAEKEGADDPDYVSGFSGRFLGEIFAWRDDIWQEDLRAVGFYLGKFIYLLDAWEDMEKDSRRGDYNLFLRMRERQPEGFEKRVETMLVDMMSQCSHAFERLPVLHCSEILRNILYSGVWCRYQVIEEQRKQAERRKKKK